MLRFVLRRVIRGVVALVFFQALLFGLVHIAPYNFAAITSALSGPNNRAALERILDLNLPFHQQLINWMIRFFSFDLGTSFASSAAPVSELLLQQAPRTLLLFLSAAIISYILGIWLGKLMAWHRGSWFEIGATIGSVAGYTSFAPWLGFLALNLFGWYLGWFPYQNIINFNVWLNSPVRLDWILGRMVLTAGIATLILVAVHRATHNMRSRRRQLLYRIGSLAGTSALILLIWHASSYGPLAADVLNHLVLPLGTLVTLSFGETMMTMRATMLETMTEDYVFTARAKGLSERVIRDHHVARNAILPALTRLLINLPFVLVGSLVIERVFFWRAMGQVLFSAIEIQDLPVLLGILSVVGLFTLLAHILVDIVYAYLDPRIRFAVSQ